MKRWWTWLGAATLVVALGVSVGPAGAATTPGAGAAHAGATPTGHGAVVAVQAFRLVTGDNLRVLTFADGTRSPQLAHRRPFAWSGGPDGLRVIPRTAPRLLRKLDPALFDTAALARASRDGRTPVVLRLRAGARAHAVTGLRVSSRARLSGRAVVRGTVGPRFTGFTEADLRDVVQVRLDAPRAAVRSRGDRSRPTHRVRVHVTGQDGLPADFAIVTLMNTVDASIYLEQDSPDDDGMATFAHVPDGAYSVIVMGAEGLLVVPDTDIDRDRTVETDLGAATVKPRVRLRGHRPLTTSLTVERSPERGWGIPFGFSGPRFEMRVQPVSGRVRHGALHTGVTTVMAAGRRADGYRDVAITQDVADGVPDRLTFVHRPRDFARLTDRFYGNGPASNRTLTLYPGDTRTDVSQGMTDVQVPVPGTLRLWVQAGPHAYVQQTIFPFATGDAEGDLTQVLDVRHYRTPGNHAPLAFLRGPVGPGVEVPPRSRAWSGAVRRGNRLVVAPPMFGSAGRNTFSFTDPHDASWSLRLGRRVLARGHQESYRSVPVPHGRRTYEFTASTNPGDAWDLSTRVTARWIFHSRAGQLIPPLLTPRYVPPTDLGGTVRPGRTAFRLAFHSGPRSPRVRRATVELSTDDGLTWRTVEVTRTSALTFDVGYDSPTASGDARYASLRVTGEDVHGNRVEETAIRAYRLG